MSIFNYHDGCDITYLSQISPLSRSVVVVNTVSDDLCHKMIGQRIWWKQNPEQNNHRRSCTSLTSVSFFPSYSSSISAIV